MPYLRVLVGCLCLCAVCLPVLSGVFVNLGLPERQVRDVAPLIPVREED